MSPGVRRYRRPTGPAQTGYEKKQAGDERWSNRPQRNPTPGSVSTAKLVPFFAATDKDCSIRDENFGASHVAEAITILNESSAREYAQESETSYYHSAVESLERANPRGEAGEWLMQLVNTLFQREY